MENTGHKKPGKEENMTEEIRPSTQHIIEDEITEAFKRMVERVVENCMADAKMVSLDAAHGQPMAVAIQLNGGILAKEVQSVEVALGKVMGALAGTLTAGTFKR